MVIRVDPNEWLPRGIAELELIADTAVRSLKNTFVVAGPGAGKTELLAQRACYLLETGHCMYPKRILAISFKRDAASNLRDRVLERCGPVLARRFDSLTFDAFAKAMVDQFALALPPWLRPTIPYDVLLVGPREEDIARAISRMRPPSALGRPEDLRAFAHSDFFRNGILKVPLSRAPTSLEGWVAQEFWRQQISGPPTGLYFPMITRLAILLVATDARVRRAYRGTYPYVFLDEFQDTTDVQFRLASTIFQESTAILTAVGDPQQRIMSWAGALRDSFTLFQSKFSADELRLTRNRRASKAIAPLVTYVAGRLRAGIGSDQDAAAIKALAAAGPPPEAVSGHIFATSNAEAEWLTNEIAELLVAGVEPREICLLVRMKTTDYATPVIDALAARGIHARVEDTMQDLLTEPAAQHVILGLRAIFGRRPGTAWAEFRSRIAELNGVDLEDEKAFAKTERTLTSLRTFLRGTAVPLSAAAMRALLRVNLDALFEVALRARCPQYTRGSFYEDTLLNVCSALAECAPGRSWDAVLDHLEGKSAIPVLTIHKSKGLEYRAVFFLGLEDGAFWNFARDPDQELNAFFVAISRAKERIAFTFAKSRTRGPRTRRESRDTIRPLYNLLRDAGVVVQQH